MCKYECPCKFTSGCRYIYVRRRAGVVGKGIGVCENKVTCVGIHADLGVSVGVWI